MGKEDNTSFLFLLKMDLLQTVAQFEATPQDTGSMICLWHRKSHFPRPVYRFHKTADNAPHPPRPFHEQTYRHAQFKGEACKKKKARHPAIPTRRGFRDTRGDTFKTDSCTSVKGDLQPSPSWSLEGGGEGRSAKDPCQLFLIARLPGADKRVFLLLFSQLARLPSCFFSSATSISSSWFLPSLLLRVCKKNTIKSIENIESLTHTYIVGPPRARSIPVGVGSFFFFFLLHTSTTATTRALVLQREALKDAGKVGGKKSQHWITPFPKIAKTRLGERRRHTRIPANFRSQMGQEVSHVVSSAPHSYTPGGSGTSGGSNKIPVRYTQTHTHTARKDR